MKLATAKLLRAGLMGLALSGLFLTSASCVSVGIRVRPGVVIRVAGPPPVARVEVRIAAPSFRHVWIDGYWDWSPRRRDWIWVPGAWKVPPRGHRVWVPPHYEERGDGWVVIGGYWR